MSFWSSSQKYFALNSFSKNSVANKFQPCSLHIGLFFWCKKYFWKATHEKVPPTEIHGNRQKRWMFMNSTPLLLFVCQVSSSSFRPIVYKEKKKIWKLDPWTLCTLTCMWNLTSWIFFLNFWSYRHLYAKFKLFNFFGILLEIASVIPDRLFLLAWRSNSMQLIENLIGEYGTFCMKRNK